MPREKVVRRLERMTETGGGGTLFFVSQSGSRRRQSLFFNREQVPACEGKEAWFERDGKGGWLVNRQAERPPGQ
jgi:hypothetical protein